ncbi:hypothetical protein EYF80_061018 [Liparis tanakae]|uniref:Uncharacterized protein n=1 Tax=Liparis tanakae TaxID=230148 RepID=A0A4Z2EK61_9TELE|nr:hypothetical protein EYF80_061018 [Liparis tanakae]
MGDRVGPVGLGGASCSQRLHPVNWSMALDRQEALDAMESTAGLRRPQDSAHLTFTHAPGTQGSFHLPQASDSASEDGNNPFSTSLEPKYFSQSFHQDQEDSDDAWNHGPDRPETEFEQGASAAHGVVYQDEEGQWVTDLAYYSSFEKEVDGKTPGDVSHFQNEDFVPAGDAMVKLAQDEEEFEKEHQFMQVPISPGVLSLVVRGDASRLPAAALRFILSAVMENLEKSWKKRTLPFKSLGSLRKKKKKAQFFPMKMTLN